MLSYQWNKQEFVKEVYGHLSKGGISAWMDIKGGIKADLVRCMSGGVENSAAVICFCTSDYQISANCETELKYAHELKIPIIPVICDENYTVRQTGVGNTDYLKWPCGWLGVIVTGKIYVDFRKSFGEERKKKFGELLTQIELLTKFRFEKIFENDAESILELEEKLRQAKLKAKWPVTNDAEFDLLLTKAAASGGVEKVKALKYAQEYAEKAAKAKAEAQKCAVNLAKVKLIMLGDSSVGKSSLVTRFVKDSFAENQYQSTIGVDCEKKTIKHDDDVVNLTIWDTAGTEKYSSIAQAYYKKAIGAIIVYDVTNANSFENIRSWLSEIDHYGDEDFKKLLVGNKSDLKDERKVSFEQGKKFSEDIGMQFLEVSAKSDFGISKTFEMMVGEIKRDVRSEEFANVEKKTI